MFWVDNGKKNFQYRQEPENTKVDFTKESLGERQGG